MNTFKHLSGKNLWLSHLIGWVIYILYAQKLFINRSPQNYVFLTTTLFYFLQAAVFYSFFLFLLPKFALQKRYLSFITYTVLVWILYFMLDYWLEVIIEVKYFGLAPINLTLGEMIFELSWHFLRYSIFACSLFFTCEYIKQLKHRNRQKLLLIETQRIAQVSEIEKQKTEFEYAYLRAQIDPHFLYNTLNTFLNRLEAAGDMEAAACLEDFSEIMKYSLENGGADNRVAVSEELKHIGKLLAIHQFRFGHQLHIDYQAPAQSPGRLVPHILLTLVENALKHAELHQAEYPLKINVCYQEERRLQIQINNRKRLPVQGNPAQNAGIGMQNLRQRLNGAYAGAHRLELYENDTTYHVTLNIDI